MLSNEFFYHGSTRKIITAFGTLFNDIRIVRTHPTDATKTQTIHVPLAYGPREKFRMRYEQDRNAGIVGEEAAVKMILPRMSFQITSFSYDGDRKQILTGRRAHVVNDDRSVLLAQYNPVPYTISTELVIAVEHAEDGLMIIEQILPFFTPDYTISVKEMPELGLVKDVPVVLTGFNNEDNYDGSWTEDRAIEWTLNFEIKTAFYPPIKPTKVTTDAKVRYFILESETPFRTDTTVPFPDGSNALTVTDGTTTSDVNT